MIKVIADPFKRITFFLYLLTFLFSVNVNGQAVFLEDGTKHPIPSVNIYGNNGNLIGFSDQTGTLVFIEGLKLVYPVEMRTQHASYESQIFMLKDDRPVSFVLSPIIHRLEEVTISRPSADFVRYRGYFRSLETFDLNIRYFSDGIVDMYVPLGKGKVKYELVQYRIFLDSVVTQDFAKRTNGHFKAKRLVRLSGVPLANREEKYRIDRLSKEHWSLIGDKGAVGHIRHQVRQHLVNYYLDRIPIGTFKTRKFFKIEAHIKNDVVMENYQERPLDKLGAQDLINAYQMTSGSVKTDKNVGHIPYEVINEFYVMEREYLDRSMYRKLERKLSKDVFSSPNKSLVKSSFWTDLQRYDIPDIPPALQSKLGSSLALME